MTRFPVRPIARTPAAILAATLLLAGAATPALAQNFDRDDIVIYGHEPLPDDVAAVSQRVSYADLHLQYPEDRRELRRRVAITADTVCDALGENDRWGGSTASCRDGAMGDAMRQVRIVEARYTQPPHGYAGNATIGAHVWLPPRQWAVEEGRWAPEYDAPPPPPPPWPPLPR